MKPSALLLSTFALLTACPGPSTPATAPPTATTATAPASTADPAFDEFTARLLAEHFARHPAAAVELGKHAFDGKIRTVTQSALEADLAQIEQTIEQLEAQDRAVLDERQRIELGTLLVAFRGERFEVAVRREPWRNPMHYMGDLNLVAYVGRDYAPVDERAQAVISIALAAGAHLAQANDNLEAVLPRTFVETALLQVRGTVDFCRTDVPAALGGVSASTKPSLDAALDQMVTALETYAAALEQRLPQANDAFALGPERFVEMLEQTQGIRVDLSRLQQLAEEDLARNLEALATATQAIDPNQDQAKTVAAVLADKPAPDDVLNLATRQVEAMRQVLVDHDLVSIPSDDPITVRPTPPFMRWNSAFLDPAGPFAGPGQPSFYYITPPDPSWPLEEQQAYVSGAQSLLFTTVHEVWPGHFLHSLHMRQIPSEVLRTFWNYVTGEGWAHYGEELIWEVAFPDNNEVRVGQLDNALLRNVRFISALGLHTGGMTVEASTQRFRTQALQDAATAKQQAVRGTFDPMYLAYTLGKIAIKKLRDDVRAKVEAEGGTFSLRAFHDDLLRHGGAPLPVIRESMLGPDAGPLL
ncbi:MAG: DUF885 domain-containing protein [Deltaproteobacteria bacterium]|nr:DUF885 domain-containing protein [Deltaproteobacteria bacterium]